MDTSRQIPVINPEIGRQLGHLLADAAQRVRTSSEAIGRDLGAVLVKWEQQRQSR